MRKGLKMYICEKHGELKTDWCDECQKIIECTCDAETIRFKDLHYDYKNGSRTVTIYLTFCLTCGKVIDVQI